MTEVVFLGSVQGHQDERTRAAAERLRKRVPDATVKVVEGSASRDLLARHKVQFGPAVVIDGRLEFVGIPRISMLVDRVLQVKAGRANPRTAGEKPGAAPAAAPPRPAATPVARPPATGSG